MKVESPAFVNGKIADKYGAKGGVFVGAMSPISFPFEILDAPEGTVSFAVVFDDPDVKQLKGFVWHHWLISGLKKTGLPEDASRNDGSLVQGVTTWFYQNRAERSEASFYGGPNPPDGPHRYVFTVYALDTDLDLKSGFEYDDLMGAIAGHIIDTAEMSGTYAPVTETDRCTTSPGNLKIAVPYDNGMIAQHFGRTECFKVYEIYDSEIISTNIISCEGATHSAVSLVLLSTGAKVLICGGLGEGACHRVQSMGMKLISGVSGSADEAVRNYLAGKIAESNAGVHKSPGMIDS